MADHNPAAMLEAALNGTLEADATQVEEAPTGEVEQEVADTKAESQEQKKQSETNGEEVKPEAKADDEIPEGAPILSKSGTYTIPFEKLDEARKKASQLAAENEALKKQVADLTAKQQANLAAAQDEAQARADAGQAPTAADQNLQAAQSAIAAGVSADLFGDFSEEAIAKGIAVLMDQAKSQIRAELARDLEPLKQERAKTAEEAHLAAIYAKHADANEIVESDQFKQWQASLPTFVRAGVEDALTKGTAEQVIEVFDTFKAQAGVKAPASTKPPMEVERRVPASLSEIVGAPPVDERQRVLQMADNPAALMSNFLSMTPEQIDAMLNRV